MTVTAFTPLASLAGGALIGLSSVLLMLVLGRIAGISGIALRALPPFHDHLSNGRRAFLLGLVAAPLSYLAVTGAMPVSTLTSDTGLLVAGGLLVGFGAIWGNGCTSGHGVCGLSRLSVRSLVAVATFMATAMATVLVTRHLL